MAWARHGHGMASVNQTRPHCVNQKSSDFNYNIALLYSSSDLYVQPEYDLTGRGRNM